MWSFLLNAEVRLVGLTNLEVLLLTIQVEGDFLQLIIFAVAEVVGLVVI